MEKEKTEYHFLAANASSYENGFKDLLDQNEEFVYWYISDHKIKKDDICYIYYSNLPDYSRRILFRGTVEESDYPNYSDKSIYKKAQPGERYAKLKMKSVAFEEPKKFSFEALKKKPYIFLKENTRQMSYMHINPDKDKRLIDDIESYKGKGHSLKKVHELFNDNYAMCFFHKDNKCKSFIEDNGFYYIEKHHLVERKLIKRNMHINNIDKLINNEDNLFSLCPLCHMKIHHATKEEKREMIKKLYKDREKFYDENFECIKGKQSVLDWLYEMYKCEDSNRETLKKYVNEIIKKNDNRIPDDLKKLLLDKDEFIKKRPSHAERSYIEFSDNMILDTNIDKKSKDEILKKLMKILKENAK